MARRMTLSESRDEVVMNRPTTKVVIVGGGTAGWITANVIAAEHRRDGAANVQVVLVESPDIPTIGVGEGTWPSMRMTLQRIGLSEDRVIRACNASFKQGTRFSGWSGRSANDVYIHPFSLPTNYATENPATSWLASNASAPFAHAVSPQATLIERGLAPKQATTPEYAFAFNYGYHLDAQAFARLLRQHAVEQLGVAHVSGNVERVEAAPDGDLEAVVLDTGERIDGELFVDCTGQRALLIGQHYRVGFTSVKDVLFNDTALAVQIPYANPGDAIASATNATAEGAGWTWDIALQTRRGVGHVYSAAHADRADALATLERYVARTSPGVDPGSLDVRTISFEPGYRQTFWFRNCVAVGLSAGFVEPLEASALALIEQSASVIATQLPRDRQVMDVVAKRFNAKLRYHWGRIVEFLKLHYAVSKRDETYWRDHRSSVSHCAGLRDKLTLWQQQPPWHDDAPRIDELFPSASYQYVLYGLGFRPTHTVANGGAVDQAREHTQSLLRDTRSKAQQAARLLPTNRALLCHVVERATGASDHG